MRIEKDQWRALLGAGVLLSVFAAGVLGPLYYQRYQYHQRIAEAKQTLGIDLAETKGLGQLHEDVERLRAAVAGAQQYVPEREELAAVLRGLSESLDAYGVHDRDVTARTTRHYATYSVVPLEVRFRASFPAVFGVLERIEQMRRLIRVDRLEVGGDGDELRELEVELELSTFIARDLPDAS